MAGTKAQDPRRRPFAQGVALHGNLAKATRDAGYSPKNAKVQGQRLMSYPDVQAMVEEEKAKLEEARLEGLEAFEEQQAAGRERIEQELDAIAFAQITDVCDFDANGVYLKSSSELSRTTTAAIAEITQTQTQFGTNVKVKLHNKMPAINTKAQMLGLLVEHHEFTEKKAKDILVRAARFLKKEGVPADILERLAAAVEGEEDA